MSGIEKECDRRIRHAAVAVLFGKAQKFVRDAAQRVQLERVLTRSGFEKLVISLLRVYRVYP